MVKQYQYQDGKLKMTGGFATAGAGGFFLLGADDVYVAHVDGEAQNLSGALEKIETSLGDKLGASDIEAIPNSEIIALFSN